MEVQPWFEYVAVSSGMQIEESLWFGIEIFSLTCFLICFASKEGGDEIKHFQHVLPLKKTLLSSFHPPALLTCFSPMLPQVFPGGTGLG